MTWSEHQSQWGTTKSLSAPDSVAHLQLHAVAGGEIHSVEKWGIEKNYSEVNITNENQ